MILALDDIRATDSRDKIPVVIYGRPDGCVAETITSVDRLTIRYL
jgi:hypothetical protein